ncbi:MAG: hypothetical protein AB8B56_21640 [Crocinitomicaceae bacterium]
MSLKNITIALFALFFLAACSNSEEKREMNEYLSAYLNDNDEVVAFGKAHINTILEKADYTSVGMLNMIIGSELEKYSTFVDAKGPIHYAAHGPLNKDGAPEKVVLFLRVTDQDGLRKHLQSEMSFDLNESNGFEYASDGDMALGFKQHLAVVVLEQNNDDEAKILNDIFTRTAGDVSEGKVAELLEADEGDIQMAVSLTNLYRTASGDIKNLPKSKQKDLEAMLTDGYVKTSLKFEDGRAIMETKNMFGKDLRAKMFMAGNSSAPILKELGSGTPRMGISVNMDVKMMEDFANELSPDALNKGLGNQYALLKMATGSKELKDLWDGKMGLVMFGDPDEFGTFTPEFNAFLGISKKGRDRLAAMEEMGVDASSMIPFLPPIDIQDNGVSLMSSPSEGGALKLPEGAEKFGKSGIDFFMNLEGLDPDDSAEMLDMDELSIMFKVSKFISLEVDNEGSRLIITAKDGKENVLKQALEAKMKEISGDMGNNFAF